MAIKQFMAVHTYHTSEIREQFLDDLSQSDTTEREWSVNWTFEKCKAIATWTGADDFFFCLWEAENENAVITSLTEYGMDDYIFTALYPIYMEIDTRRIINDRKPFKDLVGWRDKLDPKDE